MKSVIALNKKYAPTFTGDRFVEQPSYTAPYAAGKLADGFLQDGINIVNFAREMAGVPVISLDPELNDSAMHAMTIFEAGNQFTHNPIKPVDMSDSFYQKGLAAAKGNLAPTRENSNRTELLDGLKLMFMDQGVTTLGHRRNLLAPVVNKLGIGYSSLNIDGTNPTNTNVKAKLITNFGTTKNNSYNYDYIAWPSKGYFPVDWLAPGVNFSVSLNPDKYQPVDWTKVGVAVTNLLDGSTRNLVYGKTDGFYVNVENRGEGAVIAFFPKDKAEFLKAPNAGDEFQIEITGLTKTDGTPATIKYTVKLFAME
ncbi:CAP domain-containing protein [Paenibacillus sp. y28]|uniref:CAP domain-containing protein n=1 Tax=Paenibacillus sp. y28 TaxID=3129110 RepID=UPI0030159D8B